jgi:hypothetical protein
MKIHESPFPNKHGSSCKQRVLVKFNNSSIIPHNEFCCLSNFGLLFEKRSFDGEKLLAEHSHA